MIAFLLWCILLALCWPLALFVLVLYPVVWLLFLPFRVVGRLAWRDPFGSSLLSSSCLSVFPSLVFHTIRPFALAPKSLKNLDIAVGRVR